MKKILLPFVLLFVLIPLFAINQAEYYEEEGFNLSQQNSVNSHRTSRDIPEGGLLLIPDSGADRIMAFDPETGDLFDADFIPSDPDNLATPIAAALHPDGNSILVSDQIKDGVIQYDLDGNFMGFFAPAGGVNNDILDNVRGWSLKADGNILVTTASGANADAIAEFDTSGNYISNFITNGAGGLDAPFCVLYRETQDDYLVTASTSDGVFQYDNAGNFIANLIPIINFGEQITETPTGNLLIAAFSAPSGCHEYTSDGTYVGLYDVLTSLRGTYELPNGNILVTNASGVYEIDRNNNIVSIKLEGVNARFIYFVSGGETGTVQGTVTDTDTSNAIEGASITLGTYSTFTDANGDYSIEVVPDAYDLVCSYEGYEDYIEEDIIVEVDVVITIDITLQHLYNPPESLTYQFTEPDVTLQWLAPVGFGLTGYNIYRNNEMISTVLECLYIDENVPTGSYTYYVTAVYGDYESVPSNEVIVEVVDAVNVLPVNGTILHGNIPNPFNPTTAISFSLENFGHVTLEIFNVKGEKVRTLVNEDLEATFHCVIWNGKDDLGRTSSSGVYFFKMKTGSFTSTKKMVLMK